MVDVLFFVIWQFYYYFISKGNGVVVYVVVQDNWLFKIGKVGFSIYYKVKIVVNQVYFLCRVDNCWCCYICYLDIFLV